MATTGAEAATQQVAVEAVPVPRQVAFDAPWEWLALGWRDMWAAPGVSLAYGAVFAALAALMLGGLWTVGAAGLFPALAGGFLLLGPLVAVGLYEASRRLARGDRPTLGLVAGAGWGAAGQLAFFGAMLLFAFMIWVQMAFILLMLFMGGAGLPPPSAFMHTLLFTPRGLGLLIVGTIVGGIIATVVFSISALAVPLLVGRRIDAVTAARASLDAVLRNPKPMALWAALIVVMMGAGFATLLVGLALAFPLIGHATWHAYLDIYGDKPEA